MNGTSVFRVERECKCDRLLHWDHQKYRAQREIRSHRPIHCWWSYSVSGDFIFKPGVTTVVGDWNGDATSEMILQSGTTDTNLQQVTNLGRLSVGSNGTASFNAGLVTLPDGER